MKDENSLLQENVAKVERKFWELGDQLGSGRNSYRCEMKRFELGYKLGKKIMLGKLNQRKEKLIS